MEFPGPVRAVDHVSFDVPYAQFVSLVGPSGCGKSTILRLVAGLADPSAGEVKVAGMAPRQARRCGTRTSFVFQDPTLLPWRTAAENAGLPLEIAGTPRPASGPEVRGALQMVGLSEFAARRPAELSGGMRMRVSLARALVTEPHLLLLDEPFAALDDMTRGGLNDDLLRLWGQQRWTCLFVTHNIAEAVYLSQRVLVLGPRPGRLVADVAVPFEQRGTELRGSAEFARLTAEVGQILRRACG
jgi:NitT/TauT family transport system ATP-binding protein